MKQTDLIAQAALDIERMVLTTPGINKTDVVLNMTRMPDYMRVADLHALITSVVEDVTRFSRVIAGTGLTRQELIFTKDTPLVIISPKAYAAT